MDTTVKRYKKALIDDVVAFELALRQEEDFWGWEIDDDYIRNVSKEILR